jgi:hypothetical protein
LHAFLKPGEELASEVLPGDDHLDEPTFAASDLIVSMTRAQLLPRLSQLEAEAPRHEYVDTVESPPAAVASTKPSSEPSPRRQTKHDVLSYFRTVVRKQLALGTPSAEK